VTLEEYLKFSTDLSYKRAQLQAILAKLMQSDPEGVNSHQNYMACEITNKLAMAVHHTYQFTASNNRDIFTQDCCATVLQTNMRAEENGYEAGDLLGLEPSAFQPIANEMLVAVQDFERTIPKPRFGDFFVDRIILCLIEASCMFDHLYRSFTGEAERRKKHDSHS